MFGYIKTYKPEMKIREFDAYKAVYCTICKQLRKEYGIFARFTLNYDYTFLAMLRMASLESVVQATKGRCPFNPLAKCNNVHCQDTSISYACGVAMIMVYYKWLDTKQDEGVGKRFFAFLLTPFMKRWHKKATKKFPEVEEEIARFSTLQQQAENNLSLSFDEYAHPTADVLGKICSYDIPDTAKSRILYVLGYNVGKWIYLMDALDDFKTDIKSKRFNPYSVRFDETISKQELVSFAKGQMNICMDEACKAFDLLSIRNFHPILHNILFLGMDNQLNEIIRKVNENE